MALLALSVLFNYVDRGAIGIAAALIISGIIGPIVTGLIVDRLGGFGWAFVAASAVAAFGALWWGLVVPPIRQGCD